MLPKLKQMLFGGISILIGIVAPYSNCKAFSAEDNFKTIVRDCNGDGLLDTMKFDKKNFRLERIIWSKDSSSATYISDSTVIIYPAWHNLKADFTHLNLNTEDNDKDVLITIYGKISTSNDVIDTSIRIAFFSGYGFETQDTLCIDSITQFQTEPFVACIIKGDYWLKDVKQRDQSSYFSAVFSPKPINSYAKKTIEKIQEKSENTRFTKVFVSPNPVTEVAHVSTQGSSRIRSIQVINSQGNIIFTVQNIQNAISVPVNCNTLAYGQYFFSVMLQNNAQLVVPVQFIK